MIVLLYPSAKTVPSNYIVSGFTIENPLASVPGGTLDDEAWAKAARQADPNYDWTGYESGSKRVLFDHPQFANRETDYGLATQHNDILHELDRKPEVREELEE